jgi:quercetin dioxygenase-like cupin family protein
MKTFQLTKAALLIAGATLAFNAAQAQQPASRRADLQQHDLSIPGREVVQSRVEIDPGRTSPTHRHPGEEVVYVIEGSLEYTLEGKAPVVLHVGDVLFIPAGTIHTARNVGTGVGAELATYIVEKGKPLVEIVK